MPNDEQVALRLPTDLLERVDALVESVAGDPALAAWGRVSRSSVLRLAIVRGVEALEREHGKGKRAATRGKPKRR